MGESSKRPVESWPTASRRLRQRSTSSAPSRIRSSMKLLCICILALLATSNVLALTLAKDGKSDYVIVLAQSPLPANARAAKELQTHFKQMTGVELPIRDDSQHPPAHSIIVGPNRFLEADKVLGNDGFMLTTSEQKLVIIGLGPRGTMYGVYELLEKLGVRWFTAKV